MIYGYARVSTDAQDLTSPKGKGIVGRGDFVKSSAWHSAFEAEVLFQTGCISDGLYGSLNQARSARNYLAHRGETPSVQACENALEATFALISLAATDFAREDEFAGLVDDFKQAHKPRPEPLNPKFWREIPSVPGDGKWGDAPYPRHPEIELVRLQDIEKAHATRYNEAQSIDGTALTFALSQLWQDRRHYIQLSAAAVAHAQRREMTLPYQLDAWER